MNLFDCLITCISHEEFMMISESVLSETPYNALMTENFLGCFGNGPGFVEEGESGLWTLQTTFMKPLQNYTIRVEVSKDDRMSSYEETLQVIGAKAPNITLK